MTGARAVMPGPRKYAVANGYPYTTTAEAAACIGISTVRMTQLCRRGQVPGAVRFGRVWMVPAGFEWEPRNTGPKPKNGPPTG